MVDKGKVLPTENMREAMRRVNDSTVDMQRANKPMTAIESHTREKLKERLISFLKTLPKLITENQWTLYDMRVQNCREIYRQIQEMEQGK